MAQLQRSVDNYAWYSNQFHYHHSPSPQPLYTSTTIHGSTLSSVHNPYYPSPPQSYTLSSAYNTFHQPPFNYSHFLPPAAGPPTPLSFLPSSQQVNYYSQQYQHQHPQYIHQHNSYELQRLSTWKNDEKNKAHQVFDKIPEDEVLQQFIEDDQICEIVETDGLNIASSSTVVENIEKLTDSEVDLHEDLRKLKVIDGAPELYTELVVSNSVPSIVNLFSQENDDITNDVVQLLQDFTDEDAVEDNNDPARKLVNALVESENKSSEELKKRTREQNCGKKQMAEEEETFHYYLTNSSSFASPEMAEDLANLCRFLFDETAFPSLSSSASSDQFSRRLHSDDSIKRGLRYFYLLLHWGIAPIGGDDDSTKLQFETWSDPQVQALVSISQKIMEFCLSFLEKSNFRKNDLKMEINMEVLLEIASFDGSEKQYDILLAVSPAEIVELWPAFSVEHDNMKLYSLVKCTFQRGRCSNEEKLVDRLLIVIEVKAPITVKQEVPDKDDELVINFTVEEETVPENAIDFSSKNDCVSGASVERSLRPRLRDRNTITYSNRRGIKKDVARRYRLRRKTNELEYELDGLFMNNGEMDVNYSALKPGLSLEHYNAILKRFESCSDSNAIKFFDWMRCKGKLEDSFGAYSLILRVLGRREEWDRAEDLIKELCGFQGFHQSFQVFNTIIHACAKKENVKLGSKWFRMMLEFGVRPNVATIGMLMSLYQKNWNVDEAEFTFSHMRKFGVECESAYSALITIYTRLRLYGKAEEIIQLMKQERVKLNLENWLVMLNAYSQQGKMEQVESVLISMEAAGFAPNIIAYNTIITGYGKVSKMEAAYSLFHCLYDIGLEPDETTYRSMIEEGWGRDDNYEEAKHYYQELKRLGYKSNSSDLFTLINLQANYGDRDGALYTIEDMVIVGCQYSSILSTILQAYEKFGKIDEVPYVLKAYAAKDREIGETVLESGILVLSDQSICCIDEFDKMFDNARSMLHEPDEQTDRRLAKHNVTPHFGETENAQEEAADITTLTTYVSYACKNISTSQSCKAAISNRSRH